MTDAEYDALDAFAVRSKLKLVDDERLARDLDQRLRDRLRQRAHARREAPREKATEATSLTDQHPGALEIETEADLGRPASRIARRRRGLFLRVEHQEAAAARADQLAADRAVVLATVPASICGFDMPLSACACAANVRASVSERGEVAASPALPWIAARGPSHNVDCRACSNRSALIACPGRAGYPKRNGHSR